MDQRSPTAPLQTTRPARRRAAWVWLVAVAGGGLFVGFGDLDRSPVSAPSRKPESEARRTRTDNVDPVPVPSARPGVDPLVPSPADEDEYESRPAGEWQGLRVSRRLRQVCTRSEDCSDSLACMEDGVCGPCRGDDDCLAGEACVLDHCVADSNPACRRAADCESTATCRLVAGPPRFRAGSSLLPECHPLTGGSGDTSEPAAADGAELELERVSADWIDPDELRAAFDAP
jgi:hypothetical protein